ncbi:MAG: single-stranded DNA-binding protein [Thermoproteota archaeon]|nr:single-stranded DNA-binding protein [Thermoproteota archaeon]
MSSSHDFKGMLEILLRQRPELNPEQVRDLIDEKKRKVGAGYLTDQGALFLVAADLGVSFDNVSKMQTGLKDIYIGAKEATVVGRIMNIYPIHRFTKRDSNEQATTRTLVMYDKDAKVKVKLWDKHTTIPDEMGLQVGDVIKVVKGYVRAGLDGKPVINLGNYSTIETVPDDSSIPTIDSLTITVDAINSVQDNTVVSGIINSNPRVTDFTNSRGEVSKSLQLQLSDEAGSRSLRAVIWNFDESRVPKVFKTGSKVQLIGVRVKQGNPQYGSGEFEIHGDEGTVLQFSNSQEDVEVMPLRVISIGEETGKGSFMCLAVDRSGSSLILTIDNSLISSKQLKEGAMIECVPSRILGNSIALSKDDSYVRVLDEGDGDDASFPDQSKFERKIQDVQISQDPCTIEAIVLQAPETAEVNTKSGETVPVTSTLLGDDTGEIRLVGWRNQSAGVNKLNVGDRIRLIGVTAGAGREGKAELTLRPYSSITRLS